LLLFMRRSIRFSYRRWICHWNLAWLRPLLLCGATSERRREGDASSSKISGEHPVVVFGVLCHFSFCSSSFACLQHFHSLGTPCAGGRPRTINNGEFGCSLPIRGQTVGSYDTA
jgi:hypothetical protein